jgi:hypothetical protein
MISRATPHIEKLWKSIKTLHTSFAVEMDAFRHINFWIVASRSRLGVQIIDSIESIADHTQASKYTSGGYAGDSSRPPPKTPYIPMSSSASVQTRQAKL